MESAQRVKTQNLKLKGAEDQWAKYDPIFAGQDVAKALGKDSLTAADLKALIAQESGDLTENDQEGNIAGIAQMGAEEEKKSGGKPGDRKILEKAILLAAKTMARIGGELDAALSPLPAGADHKMFIMAAYNAGNNWTFFDGVRIVAPSTHVIEVYHGMTAIGTEVGTHNPDVFPRHLADVGAPALDHAQLWILR